MTIEVDPAENRRILSTDLFGTNEVSHFSFSGSRECTVSVGYRVEQGPGSTASVNPEVITWKDYWVYPGERDVVFDGVALINLGSQNALITAGVFHDGGDLVFSTVLESSLPRFAKSLVLFSDVFPANPVSIIHFQSSEPSIAIFLRGTPPDIHPGYLFQNQPLNLQETSTQVPPRR